MMSNLRFTVFGFLFFSLLVLFFFQLKTDFAYNAVLFYLSIFHYRLLIFYVYGANIMQGFGCFYNGRLGGIFPTLIGIGDHFNDFYD